MKKPDGSSQYIITLPKAYGENLRNKGIDSLLIIFNYGLGAFPKQDNVTEKGLLAFMKTHPDLQKFYAETKRGDRNEVDK